MTEVSTVTHELAGYIAGAAGRALPPAVVAKTKLHVLDTLAAMLSGARLKPGELAAAYVDRLGGRPEATVIGTPIVTSAVNAALANAMMGHADETDDSHLAGLFHPGCGIVPAALASRRRWVRAAPTPAATARTASRLCLAQPPPQRRCSASTPPRSATCCPT